MSKLAKSQRVVPKCIYKDSILFPNSRFYILQT